MSSPAQTIDTPVDERSASVFISYSHANEEFANQLIGDLGGAGHRCWIDTSKIKGGADWQRAICDGINLSYALVVVCTRKALESDYVWDEIQWARTRRKLIIPVLLEDVTDDDRFFGLHRFQGIRFDKLAHPQAVAALIAALPTPPSGTAPSRSLTQREHELAYLDRLRFEDFRLERFELAEYASLAGEAQVRREVRDTWDALAMKQEFAVIRPNERAGNEIDAPPEKFTDAVSKITELRRVVVLGEPGAGKTHTLRAIAKPLYTAAMTDVAAPLPLLVKLGNWDKPDMPFEAFLRGALGELGGYLDDLFAAGRAILLLDGLNEFPADQRATKYPQVEAYIKAHPEVMAVGGLPPGRLPDQPALEPSADPSA
ncbi:MAG: TIR domain-containing protein [Chloroflexi bacterium]|uniref:TIR domain-containing protein n=1 Tax=Candidatus Flexifilum breve TaxID=3140694 RepID=UPI00313476D6|nr:TIR domain-containing protein [Chloroflexota bacterium]